MLVRRGLKIENSLGMLASSFGCDFRQVFNCSKALHKLVRDSMPLFEVLRGVVRYDYLPVLIF